MEQTLKEPTVVHKYACWEKPEPMSETEMIGHIMEGRHQELYPEWAKTGPLAVRRRLATFGYELDILIKDNNVGVRTDAMCGRMEIIRQGIPYVENVNELYNVVYSENEVDADILEHILAELSKSTSGLRPEKLQFEAVRTKLLATLHTPTLMETTMASEALYNAGSPLWAKKMSIIGLKKRSFSLLYWVTNDLPTTRKVPNGALPHTPISF